MPVHQSNDNMVRGVRETINVSSLASRLEFELGSKQRLLVALDGPGGAGKSTLAMKLAKDNRLTSIVHGDDFYTPMDENERKTLTAESGYEQYFDWTRMRDQLLEPLSKGNPARYQRYEWVLNELAEWIDLPAKGIILVEGIYSYRPKLREFYDYSIFVSTPKTECLQRLVQRGENSDESIQYWRAAEDYYLKQTNPASSVSIIVSGSTG